MKKINIFVVDKNPSMHLLIETMLDDPKTFLKLAVIPEISLVYYKKPSSLISDLKANN